MKPQKIVIDEIFIGETEEEKKIRETNKKKRKELRYKNSRKKKMGEHKLNLIKRTILFTIQFIIAILIMISPFLIWKALGGKKEVENTKKEASIENISKNNKYTYLNDIEKLIK